MVQKPQQSSDSFLLPISVLMVTLGNFEPKTSSTIPKSTLNSAKNSSLFVAAARHSRKQSWKSDSHPRPTKIAKMEMRMDSPKSQNPNY